MIVGIFVGGRGTRMGGAVKGLLPAPDTGEPLIARLARVTREALPGATLTLVGDAAPFQALGLPALADEPHGVGPLGGLAALLRHAGGAPVVAMAADLPRVTPGLVARLAAEAPDALALAPLQDGFWNPLFARYSPACAPLVTELLARGRRSLKSLLERLGDRAVPLPLSAAEVRALDDWDTPEDVARG